MGLDADHGFVAVAHGAITSDVASAGRALKPARRFDRGGDPET